MSTKGKEYQLAVRIAGVVDKTFDNSLLRADTALKRTVASMDADFAKIDKGFNLVVKGAQLAGTATAAVGAASLKVGSEYESAFAGVKKTVEATDNEYQKLRKDVLAMSKEIPSASAEIAGVMEIAGQLGIAKDSLDEFTETMIKMGVSTNLEAGAAADRLARFANITNMPDYDEKGISNYERLGSVVVDLGNNFATTEEEIVEMATNLAATGDIVGLTQAQTMGLATAMSATGIEAEKGGSAASKMLKRIQLAVETQSDTLEDYAKVAGMTGEEFSKTFKEDAMVALAAFIDGLNDTERNGKSAIAVLDEMGITEVRMSDVILRLANAEGIMSSAIKTANQAWEENKALTIESEKRFETFESKVSLLGNAFTVLGTGIYDDLTRDPVLDFVEDLTEGVNDFTENNLPELLDGVDEVAGIVAGIGTALGTYKIGTGAVKMMDWVLKLGKLAPQTKKLLGFSGAAGAVVAVLAATNAYADELAEKNLAENFGAVSLSMEELQETAEHILNTESLEGVREALASFGELEEYSDTIDTAMDTLNKMNWKVSIGMELSESEQEDYKSAIQEYAQAAQEYALQSQYAVSLNMELGVDAKTGRTLELQEKVNQFYEGAYLEMESLGKELSDTVNKAFGDNVLDPEELEDISEIQRKMAKLQEELAVGEFEGNLAVLQTKHGGTSLTPDSFMDLQEELSKYSKELSTSYDESYARNVASANSAYEGGNLTYEEYRSLLDTYEKDYVGKLAELSSSSVNFQLSTISEAYEGNISELLSKYIDNNLLNEYTSYTQEQIEQIGYDPLQVYWQNITENMFANGDYNVISNAIGQLMEAAMPSIEEMEGVAEKCRQLGETIPQEVVQGLERADLWQSVADGEASAIYEFIGKYLSSTGNEEILKNLEERGRTIPEAVVTGLESAKEEAIVPAVEGMYAWSQDKINEFYAQGFDVNSNVRVNFSPLHKGLPTIGGFPIDNNADGGIIRHMELSWLAEEGPEAVIPLDGSRNAISLWEQTGGILGMGNTLGERQMMQSEPMATISYNPTLQFYGGAPDKQDLEEAMKVSQEEFALLIERYFKTHGRVSFG